MREGLFATVLQDAAIRQCPTTGGLYQPATVARLGDEVIATCSLCDHAGVARGAATYDPTRPAIHRYPAQETGAPHVTSWWRRWRRAR